MLTFSHICAVAENNTIGLKGKLPWDIPEDLRFFHKKTKGKALIMGRKTFESLGKPLPHRLNVVVTRQKQIPNGVYYGTPSMKISEAHPVVCPTIPEAMEFCSQKEVLNKYGSEIFIIGGGEIYKQTLPFVHQIYLTRIHKTYEGDATYPPLPKEQFKEVSKTTCEGSPSYSFITYKKT